MSSTNTINPKPCNYGCGTRIYWNTLENAYFEVFAKKKHVCPNRSKSSVIHSTNAYKSIYYNIVFDYILCPYNYDYHLDTRELNNVINIDITNISHKSHGALYGE